MLTRIKEAWKVLTGKDIVVQGKNYFRLVPPDPENKFVQLIPWRDQLLALDAHGKIWQLTPDSYSGSGFSNQLLQESPKGLY
jgi:hypothetical protein